MQRMGLFISIVLLAFMLVGCGDKNALTSEENSLIAEYAAHTVLQSDPKYEQRLVYPSSDASSEAVEDASSTETATTESQEATTEALADASTTTEASDTGDSANDGNGDSNGAKSSDSKVSATSTNKDISRLFSDLGITVSYQGYKFVDSYGDNNSSSADITPINGGQLMLVKLKLKNVKSDTVSINMLDYNYRYSVTLDTGTTYSLLTVLEDDITVFQGDIKAGKTKEVVALFEVPRGITKPNDGATFNVSNGYEDMTVALQ
ncbi:MAG: hypothetical protein K5656_09955 [Lachnospiraceae bacterium]|nr:hypothetical protein [Lachnospiraceae bacterium]